MHNCSVYCNHPIVCIIVKWQCYTEFNSLFRPVVHLPLFNILTKSINSRQELIRHCSYLKYIFLTSESQATVRACHWWKAIIFYPSSIYSSLLLVLITEVVLSFLSHRRYIFYVTDRSCLFFWLSLTFYSSLELFIMEFIFSWPLLCDCLCDSYCEALIRVYLQDPVSREHIGEINYIPQQGWSYDFYPFTGQQGYKSPLVAVHFQQLPHSECVF